jgi:hypothetical protein
MAAARGAALMAALPGTAPRQRAKRSDEESLLPPNRGQAWHETDLTGGSSSAKLVNGSAGPGNRQSRLASEMRLRRTKNSASATSASRRPAARGRLLLSGGPWA